MISENFEAEWPIEEYDEPRSPTLDEIKNMKKVQLRKQKKAEQDVPVNIGGVNFYTTLSDIGKYKSTAELAQIKGLDTISIGTYDGIVDISVADLNKAIAVLGDRAYNIWKKYFELFTLVDAAQTIEEVDAI